MKNKKRIIQLAGALLLAGITFPAQAETVTVEKTVDISYIKEFNGKPKEDVINFSETDITETLGCSLDQATVTTVNSENETIGYTANNGYWYNDAGEVCNWGTEGMAFFIEYRGVPGQFSIGFNGQNVDSLAKIGFMYNGKAVIFNVTVKMTIQAIDYSNIEIVETLDLSFNQTFEGQAADSNIQFDETAVTTALDCTIDDIVIISLDADNQYIGTTANEGYWFNQEGAVCDWGTEGMAFFIEYWGGNSFLIGFAGQDVDTSCNVGFFYNGKAVKFNVAVKMTVEQLKSVEVVKSDNLSFNETFEVAPEDGVIAFNAADVTEALGCELNQVSVVSLDLENNILAHTANNGYWYNEEGAVCNWNTPEMTYYIEYDNGASEFRIGFNGKEVDASCNIGFMYDYKVVIFEVSVKVSKENIKVDVIKTYDLEYNSVSKADYATGTCEFNETETLSLLNCSSLTDAEIISLNDDNEILTKTAGPGYWYDADGKVISYGEGCAWFIEYHSENVWDIGNFPGINNVSGTSNIGFYYNSKAVMFNIKVTISDTVGISSIVNCHEDVKDVYNLQGVKVGNDLTKLPKGIYVVNGKKVVVK